MQKTGSAITFLPLGRIVMTRNALETLNPRDAANALRRHERLDWGDVCGEDRKTNNEAVKYGFRILSAYRDRNGTKFWIITEADRSVTTILLPEAY